ncbi:dynein regulatory complex protein 9 isoform X1 [Erinaceus europaeus]|uniref:Dynein regulatory complex protein 9 n=1 Tax=Erinaceus europaeus TaxID=9365 RepID=A0A1S3APB8_ERIEU|nr:dynein regulatory complex protein 9 isoform X1 [Erinaceus europaeus]XP_060028210.1 dynein regulatory complex protein 9 isoform X1 [Erinaceus europaeus]
MTSKSADAEEGIEEPDPGATPENTDLLPLADVMRVCAVLEDTIDQLSILNYIMPVHYETRQNLTMKKSKEVDSERKPVEGFSVVSSSPLSKEENKRDQAAKEINKMQDLVFTKPTRQTILTTETLKKIQMDRKFFSDIITDTLQELEESNTYTSLLDALGQESANKVHFYDVISREENGRKQIKSLQKQLLNVKREREAEVLSRSEYIAHLKDQLQEMKAKTNMENRYMKVNSELQVSQTQKKCNRAEELLLEEIEKLRLKTEEENRIHMEIELFLRKEQQKLEEKLEFWMDKFDKDTDMKQNELNALKSAKASDLAHLQDLAKTIREREQAVIEDRIEKDKARKKAAQDKLELKSAIKLQAWWRGTVVRREIGAFRLPRRDKDNGKDSKGKGKDRRGKK